MRRGFLLLFLLGAVAACGGGGGASSPSTQAPRVPGGTTTNEALSIFVPSSSATAHAKHPQFIVPGTQSVRIRIYTINGATPSPQPADTIAQINASARGCSSVNGGISCTIDVSVPVTNKLVLEILSYASTDGSGTPLAQGFLGPIDTTSPTITPVPVALGGYISSLTLTPIVPAASPSPGVQHYTFTVTAKDANGNIILPPGNYSPSIFFSASNDPNGSVTFSPNPLTAPAANGLSAVTLTYDPAALASGTTTITATAGSVTGTMALIGGSITAGARVFEYTIPSANSQPWQITTGPNKSLWFTESGNDKFAEFFPASCSQGTAPSCTFIEGTLGTPTQPTGIALGTDGNMWIGGALPGASNHMWTIGTYNSTCASSSQGTLNGCAQATQSPDPGSPAIVDDVRAGDDGLIHAAGTVNGAADILSYWPVSSPAAQYFACCFNGKTPFGLEPTGWFTDPGSNSIGQVTCNEGCTTSEVPFASGGNPQGIVHDTPAGYVFVADAGNNAIQYFPATACCAFSSVPITTANSTPEFLTVGADGNIWFTEYTGNKIGVLVVNTMSIYEISIPTANAGPWGITLGPDGNIWFTEKNAGKIGVIVP